MNYTPAVLALSGVLAMFPLSRAAADEPPPMMSDMHEHDPGQWQKKLGLTDDQSAKLKSLHEAEKTALKPLQDKQHEGLKKLSEQVKANASDTDLQATLDDLKANRKAIEDQRASFEQQREAILTPTQRAKMLLGRMHHMKKHGGPMPMHERSDSPK